MQINNLPKQFLPIWEKSLPLLQAGRPGDDRHALEVAEFILSYKGPKTLDLDILIPTAIMHDIGHSAILPEHIKYISGEFKLPGAKLVHMLAGAKIAKEILEEVGYDPEKTKEIVDIISVHDADQIKGIDKDKFYDTDSKKTFHDIDCLDRYTPERLKSMRKLFPTKTDEEIIEIVRQALDVFFYPEFRKVAEERLKRLEKEGIR